MNYCNKCRFWSEMIAKNKGFSVQAMCLNKESPMFQKYMLGTQGCDNAMSNMFGAIDAPGNENAYTEYQQNDV